ncbi:MAG: serine O-acetyltransferase [Acidimicrobiales bacterium]
MAHSFRRDVDVILERDPAAHTRAEVILTYPGLHAVWGHHVAHAIWLNDHHLLARFLSAVLRVLTGVDIHPAATIGEGLFIDHAIGVVIGETAIVGADVTMYQGATLGGRLLASGQRHPTVGDRVMIGAGAKILGPVVIGSDTRIGANAVVVRDVAANSVIVGVPGRLLATHGHVAGPIEVDSLLERVHDLERLRAEQEDFTI